MRKFNVAWWAYSFPLTVLAMASVDYAKEVKGFLAHGVMLVLLSLCVLVSLSVMVLTALNTKMLFLENDPYVQALTLGEKGIKFRHHLHY